jgi:purine-binding chemotaxis protein CheW
MKKETRIILKNRALALAKEPGEQKAASAGMEYIVFMLAGETYGIEAGFVREVYPLKEYTTLPGVPSYILGIVNIRGRILPVIDLKKLLNLPEKGLGELNKVLILDNGKMEFGILADVVHGTQSVDNDDIKSIPPTVTGIGEEYIKGVTTDMLIVLDGEKLLSDSNIVVNDEV